MSSGGDFGGKLLVLGAEGQVGREVVRLAAARGLPLTALARRDLDITDKSALRSALSDSCSLIVNAAAYTAVDKAEAEASRAMAVNAEGPRLLAEASKSVGAPLIHLSTDYVFDGLKGAAYREGDAVAPLNVYGRSKLAGEAAVRELQPAHVILRTSWVFGAGGGNFVKTMLRLGAEREDISIVADQFGCPTPAVALAGAILEVAGRLGPQSYGIYHCAGAERTSWYDFAQAIFTEQEAVTGRAGPRLQPIATRDYPTAAPRPPDSTLDSSLFQKTFGGAGIDWRAGLTAVLRDLLKPQVSGEKA